MMWRLTLRSLLPIVALVTGTLAAPDAFGQTPTTIKIGVGMGVDSLPAYVARDQGIFSKHGLDVALVFEANTSLVPELLVSDSLQISYATAPNLLLAADGGLDLVAIAAGARLVKSNAKISLVTRPGLNVTRASDLKGRRVGLPGFNSIMDIFLRKWLIDDHVPINAVSIVEAPILQMGDLLKSGQLDAVVPLEPIRGRIIASGEGVASVDFISAVDPDVLGSFWMSTRDWATEHRTAVEAFRAALADSIAFIQANPDEARATEKKDTGLVDPTSMPTFAIKVEPTDFDFVSKVLQELGVTKHSIDAASLIFN